MLTTEDTEGTEEDGRDFRISVATGEAGLT